MKSVLGWVLALVVATSVAVAAHHSPAVFDRTKEVKLTGIVKAFKWQNPHTYLDLDVPNKKGGVDTWAVEMTSPTYLIRAGWKNNSVKVGDKVTVVVNPLKEGDVKAGIFVSLTLADGRTLYERQASEGPGRSGGSSK
jgi:Family of unknown function (DUF6152)